MLAWQYMAGNLVAVRVRCRSCGRVLGRFHGEPNITSREWGPGSLPAGGHANYWCHRRCGAHYAVRTDRLRLAYKLAMAEGHRDIWLPDGLPA
jgi:hypothetical protein